MVEWYIAIFLGFAGSVLGVLVGGAIFFKLALIWHHRDMRKGGWIRPWEKRNEESREFWMVAIVHPKATRLAFVFAFVASDHFFIPLEVAPHC